MAMWLNPTGRPPSLRSDGGWVIHMHSQFNPVEVVVTSEALREVGPASELTPSIFKYIDELHHAADEKFKRQEFDEDGSLTIRGADVRFA
jgi:hypothetical protein